MARPDRKCLDELIDRIVTFFWKDKRKKLRFLPLQQSSPPSSPHRKPLAAYKNPSWIGAVDSLS
jgi:hypothetical protein